MRAICITEAEIDSQRFLVKNRPVHNIIQGTHHLRSPRKRIRGRNAHFHNKQITFPGHAFVSAVTFQSATGRNPGHRRPMTAHIPRRHNLVSRLTASRCKRFIDLFTVIYGIFILIP